MSPPVSDSQYTAEILQAIASGRRVTQRGLARELGVALGLTNLLIRRLVAKGYVRVAGMGTRHVRYLMTTAGREALAQASRASLLNTIHLYTQTREQISRTLASVSEQCVPDDAGCKRIVFYGAGDVAEIAYVSLQSSDLTLVGIVDDHRTGRFFQMGISSPARLSAAGFDGVPASVVVTSVRHAESIRQRLTTLGVPPHRVFLLS